MTRGERGEAVRRSVAPFMTLAGLAAWSWGAPAAVRAQQPGATTAFEHGQHAELGCNECHGSGRATSTADRSWCAECHHVSVTIAECDRCHVPSQITPEPRRALVTFDLAVAEPRTRSIVFDHSRHTELSCSECHSGGGPGMEARTDCTGCHVRHHQPGAQCTACHAEPPVTAHAPEMHLDLAGCGGAGCHASEGIDFAALSEERNLCLACHVAQEDHEPGADCMDCHILGDGGPARRQFP